MTPPVFAHGHLRLYLLSLLQQRPMHGYELIQALEERFGGTYTPSAGTIYPRLAKLEEEGLVTRTSDGRKSVYELTGAGRAEVEARHDELAEVEAGVTDSVRRLADDVRSSVDHAMRSLRAELAVAARDARGAATRSPGEAASRPASANASGEREGSRPSGGFVHTGWGEGAGAERRVKEAELMIATFRTEVRARLAAAEVVGEEQLAAVRAALDAARERIDAALR